MGLGVAGLQALATARRLGAMTEGYDVRPETKEQAESLGAKFVDTGVDARGAGGYARELTQEEKDKIAAVVTKHIQSADIIITTAAIPGRPSPKLISKAQVDGMKAGSVIIDLAAEGGGNCEYTQPGETVQVGQVTIVGPLNVPSMLGEHASELYAKNQFNLIELFLKDQAIKLDWNDEVIAKTALTHAGEIKNEAAKAAEAKAKGVKLRRARRRRSHALTSHGCLDDMDIMDHDHTHGLRRPVHLHAGGLHRLRDHRPRAGDSAYAADVRLELRPRHRRGRRDVRAAECDLDRRAGRSASSACCSARATRPAATSSPNACWKCSSPATRSATGSEDAHRRVANRITSHCSS